MKPTCTTLPGAPGGRDASDHPGDDCAKTQGGALTDGVRCPVTARDATRPPARVKLPPASLQHAGRPCSLQRALDAGLKTRSVQKEPRLKSVYSQKRITECPGK
ncbi:MAG: hypothetical protein AMXMBFR34_36110 [Myxococcaceae bacterium]